jgi:hypothetical protein
VTRTKTRLPHPTEAEVTRAVLDAARCYGLVLERQNTGAALNPSGRLVTFGTPGDPDYRATFRGRSIGVEAKHGGFDPRRLRGAGRAHFDRQLARLKALNDAGGFGVWLRDGADAAHVFRRLAEDPGLRVEFDDAGFPWLVDDEG